MYSILNYGTMIADRPRMEAYSRALKQSVDSGSIVLDLGTGTGIMALLAASFGAKRVYAVEPGDAIVVARELARANGLAARIEFIQDLSGHVSLPEPVDIIVSDLRGSLPFHERHLPSIVDARSRLLRPGGTLIPLRDRVWVAVVESPSVFERCTAPWKADSYGLDLGPAVRYLTNSSARESVEPKELLTPAAVWATVDYSTVISPHARGEVTWTVPRGGTGHGLQMWFDTDLADGIGFSNSPHAPKSAYGSYGSLFFPWETPLALEPGDAVTVGIRADLLGESYHFGWRTIVDDVTGLRKAELDQSTFRGMPLSAGRLWKRASSHVPRLRDDGAADAQVLASMDGRTSLQEIARALTVRFPLLFGTFEEAFERVAALSEKYSS